MPLGRLCARRHFLFSRNDQLGHSPHFPSTDKAELVINSCTSASSPTLSSLASNRAPAVRRTYALTPGAFRLSLSENRCAREDRSAVWSGPLEREDPGAEKAQRWGEACG